MQWLKSTLTDRRVFVAVAAAVVAMALFPPWSRVSSYGSINCGYHFLLTTPLNGDVWPGTGLVRNEAGCGIDLARLLSQWIAVAGTAVLYFGWSRLKR